MTRLKTKVSLHPKTLNTLKKFRTWSDIVQFDPNGRAVISYRKRESEGTVSSYFWGAIEIWTEHYPTKRTLYLLKEFLKGAVHEYPAHSNLPAFPDVLLDKGFLDRKPDASFELRWKDMEDLLLFATPDDKRDIIKRSISLTRDEEAMTQREFSGEYGQHTVMTKVIDDFTGDSFEFGIEVFQLKKLGEHDYWVKVFWVDDDLAFVIFESTVGDLVMYVTPLYIKKLDV